MRGLIWGACAALLSVLPNPASADLLSDIKSRGNLVCGVLSSFEPYAFQDPKTRELVGYEVDFCRELAGHLGVKATMKVVSTQGRVPELLQNRVDVLAALVSYTKERAKQMDFSGIYIRVPNKFLVLDRSNIRTANELKDKKVGLSKGSALEVIMRERFPSATVVSFDDKSASYLALKTGKIDALLTVVDVLMAFKNRDPDGDKARVLEEDFYVSYDSFNVKPGEPAFLSAVNEFLAQAEKSGLAQRIFDKWFGPDTVYKLKRDFAVGTPPVD